MEIARARLKAVLREPGCALCRLRLQAEQRYYAQILFDRVNDGELRLRLARSIGFCPTHTRGLLQADLASEPPGLGFAILHAALGTLLREDLNTWLSDASGASTALSARRTARRPPFTGGISRLLPERDTNPAQEWLLALLSPSANCSACESVAASEQVFLRALVRDLATTDLRAAYGASEGLCLHHLRLAVACTPDDETLTLLMHQAVEGVGKLVADLEAYLDGLSRPDRPRPAAMPSLMRAAAFFAGHGHESD
jgi:hypothetical protein